MDMAEKGNPKTGKVGILTFHCSDNFGSMLQAYALKRWLLAGGAAAEIVRYEPPFLTGRHWLMPYIPSKGVKGRLWTLANMGFGLLHNLQAGRAFAEKRRNMHRFRMTHLIDRTQPRILFLPGLKRLPYRCYVVGSDQIWNPEITRGLRKAYFGAFADRRKARVVAYGASLGSDCLPAQYDRPFGELIRRLDAVSVREAGAAAYVRQFFPGEVAVVTDPVFFLTRPEWQAVERAPELEDYILVYTTEPNQAMADYVRLLSAETGLPVAELHAGAVWAGGAGVDTAAGPAEFLGYINHARYVVSNSFHAAAFSILFEKQFLIFAHRRVNERLASLLTLCGLEDRLCQTVGRDITVPINWPSVRVRTAAAVEKSADYLLKSVEVRPE